MAIDNIFQEDGSSSMDNNLNQAANLGGIGDVVQGAGRFIGNALDKFREKRDERRAIKSFDDEVNNKLNVDSFKLDENANDPLSAAQRINLSGRGVIDDITQADVQRGGGVQQVGTQSGSIIGSQPIFVSKQSALPISLFEKRKKAIVDAAAKKNKAIADYLKIPDNVDPMYDRKITDEFVRLSDELASYPNIDLTDYSDPRVREFMEKRARVESLSRVFDKESGVIARARGIMDEVKTSGGDFVMDSKAYKDAQDLLLGRYSEQDLINDPKVYQKFLDVAGRIEAESSAINIFKTNIKPNIEKNLSSWIEGSDIKTLGALGVEEVSKKFMDDKRLNDFVDEVTEGLNFSDARLKQVKKIAAKAYANEVAKKFKTIQTGQSASTSRTKKETYTNQVRDNGKGYSTSVWQTDGVLKNKSVEANWHIDENGKRKQGVINFSGDSGNAYLVNNEMMHDEVISSVLRSSYPFDKPELKGKTVEEIMDSSGISETEKRWVINEVKKHYDSDLKALPYEKDSVLVNMTLTEDYVPDNIREKWNLHNSVKNKYINDFSVEQEAADKSDYDDLKNSNQFEMRLFDEYNDAEVLERDLLAKTKKNGDPAYTSAEIGSAVDSFKKLKRYHGYIKARNAVDNLIAEEGAIAKNQTITVPVNEASNLSEQLISDESIKPKEVNPKSTDELFADFFKSKYGIDISRGKKTEEKSEPTEKKEVPSGDKKVLTEAEKEAARKRFAASKRN